jgi:tRNA(Ile2) C34 agmatinyltransferase TiaS
MLYIGLDDTDSRTSRGTGHLARELAARLQRELPVYGVTRHQLLNDPRVRMTAKNSANVIHVSLDGAALLGENFESLMAFVVAFVSARSQPEADPGLCVGVHVPQDVSDFGHRAQQTLVTRGEAQALAMGHGLVLRALGGDGSGIIGALAGVGLAATGNDGRFTQVGHVRDLAGVRDILELRAAGIAAVQTLLGEAVRQGHVETGGKVRPALIRGEPVLFVEPADGGWRAIRRD